jgi:hypothetical protein
VPSEVTIEPAELKPEAVPVQPEPATSGGEAGRDVELEGVVDGGAVDLSGDLTVAHASDEATGAGTADVDDGAPAPSDVIDAGTEVHPPQVVHVGTAVENEEALPITPRRTDNSVIGTVAEKEGTARGRLGASGRAAGTAGPKPPDP